MRKTVRIAVKFIIFVITFAIVVYAVCWTVTKKYQYRNQLDIITSLLDDFYDIDKNTVDVLLLGSSHMGAGVNPQDIYDETGIRSYNLSSPDQAIWMSYFWLEEALQYQSPSVVILDCFMLYIDASENEAAARYALDGMRTGAVKMEAAEFVSSLDASQTSISYLLRNVRYHTRWTELDEWDFTWWEEDYVAQSKGFFRLWEVCGDETYEPLTADNFTDDIVAEAFDENAGEYLNKIVQVCEENDIELILIKTPGHCETEERHVAIQEYADENGLAFYDFNMEDLYKEINFDYASDMYDSDTSGERLSAHANPSGARKISTYLANQLAEVYGIEGVYDEQWEETEEFNEHVWQNFSLGQEEDLVAYLEMLDQERYSIFISVKDEASAGLTDDVVEAMQKLGFSFDLSGCSRYSYIAIKNGGEITEILENQLIETSGALRNGRVPYFVTSAGYESGNTSSIMIDGTEYSLNSRGLNIVVYDNEIRTVIDQVCFDTYLEDWTATR